MASETSIKLKKNESFHIREGWFEKAMMAIAEKNTKMNIFGKSNGVDILGIGSNMVKGLHYWMIAADLITKSADTEFTDFGKVIQNHDPFLESKFSWFMIHYKLTTNSEECPIANEVFNMDTKVFEKNSMVDMLEDHLKRKDKNVKRAYIDSDLGVFLRSYVSEDTISNPEDNYVCPLSALKLMRKTGNRYEKTAPVYASLSYLNVYYALTELYRNEVSFVIEDSMKAVNSPARIFNLDQYMYLQYLEEMHKAGLVTITKTAGLNTVTFEDGKLSIEQIFKKWEETRNVR